MAISARTRAYNNLRKAGYSPKAARDISNIGDSLQQSIDPNISINTGGKTSAYGYVSPTNYSGGGDGSVQPTVTEQRLQQSLPIETRNLSAEEVVANQSLSGGQSLVNLPSRTGDINQQRNVGIKERFTNLYNKGKEVFYKGSGYASQALGTVANVKVPIPTRGGRLVNVADVYRGAKEGVNIVGKGWSGLTSAAIDKLNIPTETYVEDKRLLIPRKETLVYEPTLEGVEGNIPYGYNIEGGFKQTIAGSIPEVVEKLPSTAAFLAFPEVVMAGEAIDASQQLQNNQMQEQKYRQELEKVFASQFNIPLQEGERTLTIQEIEDQYGPQLKEQIKQQQLSNVGLPILFLGTGIATKGLKYINKPIIETRGGQVTSEFVAEQQSFVTPKGRKFNLNTYKTITITTPTEIRITTPLRKLLGTEGNNALRIPFINKYKTDWTPINAGNVKIGEPFAKIPILEETPFVHRESKIIRGGTKYGEPKYFGIEGKSMTISPENIASYGDVVQYQARELLSKVRTGGIPIKNPVNFIKEGEQLALGDITTTNFLGKQGKQTRRYQPVSLVSNPTKVGDIGDLYRVDINYKDMTKPNARATGKLPYTKGTVLVKKPIQLTEEQTPWYAKGGPTNDVKFLKPNEGGKKTSFDSTFQVEEVQKIFSSLPPPKLPKIKTPKITVAPTVFEKIERPVIVGGSGVTSLYAGKGMYERTEGGILPGILLPTKVSQDQYLNLPSRDFLDTATKIDTKVRIGEELVYHPKIKTELTPLVDVFIKHREKTIIKEKVIPQVFVGVRERVNIASKIIPKVATKLKIGTTQVNRPRVKQPPPPPPKPKVPRLKIPIIYPPKLPSSKRGIGPIVKDKNLLYIPEVKRYGKFMPIGKPTSLQKALEFGTGRLRTTLGASLRVRQAGTNKFASIGKESKTFRPGKSGRDIFTLVQKRRTRLGTPQEVAEIKLARGGFKW